MSPTGPVENGASFYPVRRLLGSVPSIREAKGGALRRAPSRLTRLLRIVMPDLIRHRERRQKFQSRHPVTTDAYRSPYFGGLFSRKALIPSRVSPV